MLDVLVACVTTVQLITAFMYLFSASKGPWRGQAWDFVFHMKPLVPNSVSRLAHLRVLVVHSVSNCTCDSSETKKIKGRIIIKSSKDLVKNSKSRADIPNLV